MGQIPWVGIYVKMLPGVGMDLKRFRAWAMERFIARKNEVSKRKDLFYHLVRNLKLCLLVMHSTSDVYFSQTKRVLRNNQSPLRSYSRIPLSLLSQVSKRPDVSHGL